MEKTDFKYRYIFYAGDVCPEFLLCYISPNSIYSELHKYENGDVYLYSKLLITLTRRLFGIYSSFRRIKRPNLITGVLYKEHFKPVWKSIARMPNRDYKDDDENYSRIMNLFDTVLKNTGGDEINIILTNDVENDEWRNKKEFQPWNI